MRTELTITADDILTEPEISWFAWTITFLMGFLTGATGEMFALWLFAHYLHR